MKYTIAIIDQNGEELIEGSTLHETSTMVKENVINLINQIPNYVKLIDVKTPHDMMEQIIEIIGLTPDMMGITTTCFEDNNFIYQMIHLDMAVSSNMAINSMASTIAYDKIRVNGKAVLFKSEMLKNNQCFKPCNINMTDIKNIIESRTRHCGILLNPSGTYEEKLYYIDPIECCESVVYKSDNNELIQSNEKNNKKLKTFVKHLMGFQFVVVYDDESIQQNNLASKLIDNEVHGTVFIFIRLGDHDFMNLTHNMFEQITNIMENNMEDLQKEYEFKYIISQYRKLNELYKIE